MDRKPPGSPAGTCLNHDTGKYINAVAATTTKNGDDLYSAGYRGVKVVLDMTTVGTGSVTLTIQGKDLASGKYYTLLAGAAVITDSMNVYTVFPGAPATGNVSANDQLPQMFRVIVTANNGNATSYTIGVNLLV